MFDASTSGKNWLRSQLPQQKWQQECLDCAGAYLGEDERGEAPLIRAHRPWAPARREAAETTASEKAEVRHIAASATIAASTSAADAISAHGLHAWLYPQRGAAAADVPAAGSDADDGTSFLRRLPAADAGSAMWIHSAAADECSAASLCVMVYR